MDHQSDRERRSGGGRNPDARAQMLARKRLRRRKRLIRRCVAFGLALAAVIVLAVVLFHVFQPASEKGFWTIDGVTSYRFDGKGSGAMVLPAGSYDFSYEMKDGRIYLDFAAETARDADYEYVFRDGCLVFISAPDSSGKGREFVLTRAEE